MLQLVNCNPHQIPWNIGKLAGQKLPLKLQEIWTIRILTIPKRGYRLLKPVLPLVNDEADDEVIRSSEADTPQLTEPHRLLKLGTVKKFGIAVVMLLAAALTEVMIERSLEESESEIGGDESSSSEAITSDASDGQSIVVLPFVNMSDDASNEYFSDGISEELLNLLAKIPKLRVISRTSAFAYKGKDINIPTIAAQLNVAHVLEGSVRKDVSCESPRS